MTPLRWPSIGRRRALLLILVSLTALAGATLWRRSHVDSSLLVPVRRGALTARLTAGGTLRPIESLTYRSPLAGREVEIVALAPEGTRVAAGDLLVRLDTSELERDVERARHELRQAEMDLQLAEIERAEAEAAVEGVAEGEGALAVEEARTRFQLAQKRADRLREEHEQLRPLMEKGVITRDELKKTADEAERAEEELVLARKRANVVLQVTHPRERQRAALLLAQKNSQLETLRARVRETQARLELLRGLVEGSSLYARRPGLVVHEEFLAANPRRKIRVGDRVTASQGIVTIPEVDRMLVEASVAEEEVHRVRPGQPADVRVEAFPDLKLAGKVARVGTLARSSIDRPFDDKRFDLVIELDSAAAELRPEMTARVDIIVGTRSDVLLLPVNAVYEELGAYVAYVPGRSGIETRAIELGESDDWWVEIVAGLHENERVMLVQPGSPVSTPEPAQGGSRVSGHALQPR